MTVPHALMDHSHGTESPLGEYKARYEGLLKAAVEGIIVIDARGTIEEFSAGAEHIFGYSTAEAVGQNVRILMPESHAHQHDSYLDHYHRTHERRIIGIGREAEGRHKSGRLFPVDIAVGEIQTPEGIKFVGILRDISRRRQAEQALAEREEETRLILEHAPVGILVADPRGYLMSINPALGRLLGAKDHRLGGRRVTSLFTAEAGQRVADAMAEAVTRQVQVTLREISLACQDGSTAKVAFYIEPVLRNGVPSQIIGQIIDRSAEIEAQAVARRIQEEFAHVARLSTLGEMATAIAHEINQPLTAIANRAKAYRRMLQNSQATAGEIADGLDLIAEQALQIGQVVKRVRAFVARREMAREPVQLTLLIRQVLELAELDAHRAGVAIELEPAPALSEIDADPVQIQQVLLNLLRNAIDASLALPVARRRVKISMRQQAEAIILEVCDQGSGVPVADQPRLFQPFFTTKEEGVGLGLSLSRSILEAHGGTLTYRDNPGGGACFELMLPTAESRPAEPP